MKNIKLIIGSIILTLAAGLAGVAVIRLLSSIRLRPPVVSVVPAYAMGPISTFGSVVVNGVRYDTSSAVFTVNGLSGSQDDLSVGQVITVSGTIDDNGVDGDADEVNFDDNVKGPVQSIDPAMSQIVVLGQTVLINPETSFDDSISPASIDGLDIDDIVEVSGLVDADRTYHGDPHRTETCRHRIRSAGYRQRSRYGQLPFQHQQPGGRLQRRNAGQDFSGGQISDGDFVEAKGMSLNIDGELVATRVELKNALPDVADGVHVEIQGFITRFMSATDFDVTGLPVTTTASTVYEGGDAKVTSGSTSRSKSRATST